MPLAPFTSESTSSNDSQIQHSQEELRFLEAEAARLHKGLCARENKITELCAELDRLRTEMAEMKNEFDKAMDTILSKYT
tara:strand:- start:482 stop:721 length:240 start_codon:yes stop_codon:yes gene_type:complete